MGKTRLQEILFTLRNVAQRCAMSHLYSIFVVIVGAGFQTTEPRLGW